MKFIGFCIAFALVLGSFGGAHADVKQLSYKAPGDIELQYLVAAPTFETGSDYPVWIFQPGDGTIADEFQPGQFVSMMDSFAKTFGIVLIMPQLRRQLYTNDLKRYCELDFFHRMGDLSELIDSAKKLPFINAEKIIVWGYSAGGIIATLTAKKRHDIWGVVTYGSGVASPQEAHQKLPVTPDFLVNNCSDPKQYLNRSGTFWKQLFEESTIYSDIRELSAHYFALFGESDPVTPFDTTQAQFAEQLAHIKPTFSYQVFPGLDHTGYFNPAVVRKMMNWGKN